MLEIFAMLPALRWPPGGAHSYLLGALLHLLYLTATIIILAAALYDLNTLGGNQTGAERGRELPVRGAHGSVPAWKRALDCSLIILSAPLWLPVALVLAMFVKFVSPGPVLFGQERVGHMGGRFRCLKFRTMKVNADTTVHREHVHHLMQSNRPMKKLDNTGDKRLIPGGLWLRTLGVDELPQLINVLRGEMSLVGPRPTTVYEYEMLEARHRRRCGTLPGLTGLWQVNGKNRTTFERMMELDLHYVENKSLFMDVGIIARTVPAILVQVWDVKMGSKFGAKAAVENAPATAETSGVPLLAGVHGNDRPSGSACK